MSAIALVPNETLNYVYSKKTPDVFQELNEPTKRIDRIGATTKGYNNDIFQYQQSMPYMYQKIKMVQQFKVQIKTTTTAPTWTGVAPDDFVTNVPTSPSILNSYNHWFDNFCLSKMVRELKIKWGDNEIYSNSQNRSPFLMELESAMLDMDACKEHGLIPLEGSGIGNMDWICPKGPLSRTIMSHLQRARFDDLQPLSELSVAQHSKIAQNIRTMNNSRRVTLKSAPVFKKGDNTALLAKNDIAGYAGTYIPSDDGLAPYYGTVIGEYVFQVEEYLLDRYLYTPYHKNKTPKSLKITPFLNCQIDLQYNNEYIQNGLFKYNPTVTKYGTSLTDQEATTTAVTVTRVQETSEIELESFDVTMAPGNGLIMKQVVYVPENMASNADGGFSLADGATSNTITILDQSSEVIPPYYLFACDPRLWNGLQNSTLATGNVAPFNYSTFFTASIASLKIQIGQDIVTQNIPLDELKRDTLRLMRNKEINEMVYGNRRIPSYSAGGNWEDAERGLPFLLIDTSRLNMISSQYGQLLPNVRYPALQTVKIEMTFKAPYISGATSLTFYPIAYKFYPKAISQTDGQPITQPTDLVINFEEAIKALKTTPTGSRAIDLDLVMGGTWFSELGDYIKKNGKKWLRTGIDILERGTRDAEGFKLANDGLNIAKSLLAEGSRKGRGKALR